MPTLNDFQNEFVRGLKDQDTLILNRIKSTTALSEKEHLAIYQSSVIAALQKTLKDIYSVCVKLVGDAFFIRMTDTFIEGNPSTSPDLANYGENFPFFIAGFSPAKSLPYLSDTAKLEWAWHKTFTAKPALGLDFQKLSDVFESTPDKIIFSLPEECFLIYSRYPIHKIWEMNQTGYTGDETLQLEENTHFYFLVWRKDLEMRIDVLTHVQWQFLTWVQEKKPLEMLCDQLELIFPEVNIADFLPHCVTQGWLNSFSI